jgi:hypothetical protein
LILSRFHPWLVCGRIGRSCNELKDRDHMKNAGNICSYLVTYAKPSLSDLTDEHIALAASPGDKTAGWIIGHLCITGDFVRRKAGRPAMTPKDWGPRFAPGSKASGSRDDYPPMAELIAVFEKVYLDLAEAAPSFRGELLAGPNPFELARHRFSTMGDFTNWIMTGHLGYHLGQLSGWRASFHLPLRPRAPDAI